MGVPVGHESGGARSYFLADFTLDDMTHDMLTFLIRYLFATIAVTAFMGFIIARLMERTTVKPINAIAKAAQSYVEDRRSGNTSRGHFSSLPIRTGDEVEHLNLVMAQIPAGPDLSGMASRGNRHLWNRQYPVDLSLL